MSQAESPMRMKAAFMRALSPAMRMSEASASAKAAPHAHDDLADSALRIERGAHVGRRVAARAFLQIEAGAISRPGSAQHHDASVAIGVEAMEIVEQLADHDA